VNKQKKIQYEAAVTKFNIQSQKLSELTEENHKKNHNIRCLGWYSDRTLSEYKPKFLRLEPLFGYLKLIRSEITLKKNIGPLGAVSYTVTCHATPPTSASF
jgi:hypothetical protein